MSGSLRRWILGIALVMLQGAGAGACPDVSIAMHQTRRCGDGTSPIGKP